MLTALSGTTGIASARADYQSFVHKLHDAGIYTPRGDNEVKEWGAEVCALRDRGKSPRQWLEQGVYGSQSHPPYGLTKEQANFIVDTAVSDLCDDREGPPPYLPAPG
ncbi:DUF732 domain-containing protein [Mycobacterium colombiense]|uniref:DUF732 domain-containing protein n=1 Tax=Mycobacterium colombiense TaxID=339268 RepID=UPI001E2E52D6|nr:DUF732 domain-containing protein [Mycobacterium colombiense]